MRQFWRTATACALSAFLTIGAVTPGEAKNDDDIDFWLSNLPLEFFPDCGNCVSCASGRHYLQSAPLSPDRRYGEPNHNCADGWCSVAHPESELCSTGLAALTSHERATVWAAVVTGSVSELAQLAALHGEMLTMNTERRALQAVNCQGEVSLSIPLSNAQLIALAG